MQELFEEDPEWLQELVELRSTKLANKCDPRQHMAPTIHDVVSDIKHSEGGSADLQSPDQK